jgi:hypothetical protein
MKKVLIFIAMAVWTGNVHAIKLCGKTSSHPWIAAGDLYSRSSQTNSSYTVDGTFIITFTGNPTGSISGQSRCAANGTTDPPVADTTGRFCWCRATNVVDTTNGKTCDANNNGAPWGFYLLYSSVSYCQSFCAEGCAESCVRHGSYGRCSRIGLLTIPACEWLSPSLTPASAVTCPLSGTCTSNSDYKTVADTASCGDGYVETTSPALTISGTYSDSKGSFTYGNCTAN